MQALLGVTLVVGAVYTARTFRITKETHLTERLTAAVGQLDSENPDVTTGAILALDRLGADSERDRPVVLELPAGYIQTHAPLPEARPEPLPEGAPAPTLRNDIQAALSAVSRQLVASKGQPTRTVNLSRTQLRGAQLTRADLAKVQLGGCDLTQAELAEARRRHSPRRRRLESG